ncbi:hypothetical protein K449DRAFT_437393 [Hypoxylon sp. EC38]|nr:hypothetical protein K449DRAFT_437393 [Hypoxylon sp. EC38]
MSTEKDTERNTDSPSNLSSRADANSGSWDGQFVAGKDPTFESQQTDITMCIPASRISSRELKEYLDCHYPGQYSVQRRDSSFDNCFSRLHLPGLKSALLPIHILDFNSTYFFDSSYLGSLVGTLVSSSATMAEESQNGDVVTQPSVDGHGLHLAFDGFNFGDLPIRGFAMDALMTPIEGIQPGDLTIYNNALSLLTAAFSAKEKWTKDSEEEFKMEIGGMWGLTSSGTALFLVRRFMTARRRFQHAHRGIVESTFPVTALKADGPIVTNALNDIRSLLVKPQWKTHVVGLLTPDPGAPPTARADAEQHPNAVVSCEDLATLLQDEFITRGLLENPVHHEYITKLINNSMDPPTRTKLWQMIIEARTGHSGDRVAQAVCNNIFRSFSSACLLQEELQQSVRSLKTWATRLKLPPLDVTDLQLYKNKGEDNRDEAKLAGGEEHGTIDNDKDDGGEDDDEVNITLSRKRKAKNSVVSKSKRGRQDNEVL